MKYDWSSEELVQHFTLTRIERDFLGFKGEMASLSLAVLLRTFQVQGHFLNSPQAVADTIVRALARQLAVSPALWDEVDWTSRTARRYRDEVAQFCGFRAFRSGDEDHLIAHLTPLVADLQPDVERLKQQSEAFLREQRIVPPSAERLTRCRRTAVNAQEVRWIQMVQQGLSTQTRQAFDALISTDAAPDDDQPLLVIRSTLATLKDTAGRVKVDTVLEELAKLAELRALGLPPHLFQGVPPRVVGQYRHRAASEPPRELRRHPEALRHVLLAALCWERLAEVTDDLVELLISVAHHIGTRAESKVEAELLRQLRRVRGKSALLFKLAKAARAQPEGAVRAVIYPVVPEPILDDLIREMEAENSYDRQVRLVTRNSYGYHYRRAVSLLLDALIFRCNNDRHRPIMRALDLLSKYRDRRIQTFPLSQEVPLGGVVKDDWQPLVLDDPESRKVNRVTYEMCVLATLRDKIRCKEVWIEGARRFRNPDDDLPTDFEDRRAEYYSALGQPSEAQTFTCQLRLRMQTALDALNTNLPTNASVKLIAPKNGKGRLSVSPLSALPEPQNITRLAAALVQRWPMTNLLDVLKETELRTGFTDVFQTAAAREVLSRDVVQRRLLLCLHGIGTNAGLKRMCSGGGEDSFADLQYIRRR